jgi:hypothetical protein
MAQTKMSTPESLIEKKNARIVGYAPLVAFREWRVAVLCFIDELLPERLATMQRHDETDEVFVLLSGRCILFLGEGRETVGKIYAEDMRPFVTYNVKRGAWHTHTLSQDASVLIVENQDTSDANSPAMPLSREQQRQIQEFARSLWGASSDTPATKPG